MPESPRPAREEGSRALGWTGERAAWPMLLRAFALALRPARIGLCALLVLVVALVARIDLIWTDRGLAAHAAERAGGAWARAIVAVTAIDLRAALGAIGDIVLVLPAELAANHLVALLICVPIVAVAWMVVGAAVCRLGACDFAQRLSIPWTAGAAFALGRVGALAATALGPIMLAGLGVGVLALGGLMFSVPVLNVVGGLLYGLYLLAGAGVVLVLACTVLSWPLLPAGIACEGTDAIDAIQRSFAYVLGRPGRLAIALGLLLVQLVVATLVAGWALTAVVGVTEWGAGLMLGEPAREALRGPSTLPGGVDQRGPGGLDGAARQMVGFWLQVPALLATSIVLSVYFSCSTIMYLYLRQIADGQDASDIWMPGMVGGTRAPEEPLAPETDDDEM